MLTFIRKIYASVRIYNRYLGLEKKINKSVQDFIKCITLHYILSQIK
jgi:hypothetical protein